MITTVYFVRHCEPNYENHDDMSRELTEKGICDRRLVSDFLSDKGVSAVYSSPFKRAVDTVSDFAGRNSLEIGIIGDLRERRVGEWTENFAGFAQRQWEDFDYKLPLGESLNEVQKRNISALLTIVSENEGRSVAVGSHGTALSTVINFYDKSFGCADFEKIRSLMPWIVEFKFDGSKCVGIVSYDLFTGERKVRIGK